MQSAEDSRGNIRPTLPDAADDRLHLVKVAPARGSVQCENVPVLEKRRPGVRPVGFPLGSAFAGVRGRTQHVRTEIKTLGERHAFLRLGNYVWLEQRGKVGPLETPQKVVKTSLTIESIGNATLSGWLPEAFS